MVSFLLYAGIRTLNPSILYLFFSLLRKRVALRAISFACSLRPNTKVPALLEDVELAGRGALQSAQPHILAWNDANTT